MTVRLFELEPKERGEWWEIGGVATDPVTKRPKDVTGKVVDIIVRDGPDSNANEVSVSGKQGTVVDGPNGVIAVGGRLNTPARYWGTVTVGIESDGPGWPLKGQVVIPIVDCP